MVVSQNRMCIMENSLKIDDFGGFPPLEPFIWASFSKRRWGTPSTSCMASSSFALHMSPTTFLGIERIWEDEIKPKRFNERFTKRTESDHLWHWNLQSPTAWAAFPKPDRKGCKITPKQHNSGWELISLFMNVFQSDQKLYAQQKLSILLFTWYQESHEPCWLRTGSHTSWINQSWYRNRGWGFH